MFLFARSVLDEKPFLSSIFEICEVWHPRIADGCEHFGNAVDMRRIRLNIPETVEWAHRGSLVKKREWGRIIDVLE